MVRDGISSITKLEFLQCIQGVRKQAFKRTTIHSAFKKTGIWPLNPQVVLKSLHSRAPAKTPSPDPEWHGSSDFETPTTLRQINKVANKLGNFIQEDEEIDDELRYNLDRFIRGALISATELVQTKKDLSRTRAAEIASLRRRASKNRPLKTGGILSIKDGRRMVTQRAVDEYGLLKRRTEALDKKARNAAKKRFEDAAKKARKLRMEGRLSPLEVYDGSGVVRLLRRG
jgi:hypothetical protein